ncbi:MAG: carbonic anhydrase, partial [Deltaproteobacteria bacterium]
FIRERVEAGRIEILGWHYIIETGEIYNFNDRAGVFEKVGAGG